MNGYLLYAKNLIASATTMKELNKIAEELAFTKVLTLPSIFLCFQAKAVELANKE